MNKKTINLLLEIISLIALISGIFLVIVSVKRLPDNIPTHFSFNGIPDDTGNKNEIWLLPIMGGLIYVVLTFVGLLNKFMKRNDEKTAAVMGMVRSMILQLKLVFSLIFLSLIIGTILISDGQARGLGIGSTPTFLLLLALVLVINIWRIGRALGSGNNKK
ncbi:MAG: DUF1648 domain-containing protein [Bacteroidetes bacterium]|nr:DUF1648 domain-containing protein [Bacteroidota bacterium]